MFPYGKRFSTKSPSQDPIIANESLLVKKEGAAEVLVTLDAQDGGRKHMHARVEAAMATKERLSNRGILLGIQKAERDHKLELQDVEKSTQGQRDLLHRLTDQIGSTDDDEANFKTMDEANAKIRELKANEKEISAMLKQSQIDREELEGRLSTHQAEVDRSMNEVHDLVQGQPEKKRHNPGLSKRDFTGDVKKLTGVASAAGASWSSGRPANARTSTDDGGAVGPRSIRLSKQSSSDVVPSSSHSSPASPMDDSDDGDLN
ncbi:hypothetical protein PSPO01_08332 [Paraphaeosphaeria sporulosa]